MLNPPQILRYVIEPTLRFLDPEIPHSKNAAAILLLTAAHESRFTYVDQLDAANRDGPAYGLWQMEAATLADHHKWLATKPALHRRIVDLMAGWPTVPQQLRGNLYYACAMARVHYRRAPEALPDPSDLPAIAALWKLRYNTVAGRGTVAQFEESARRIGWPMEV